MGKKFDQIFITTNAIVQRDRVTAVQIEIERGNDFWDTDGGEFYDGVSRAEITDTFDPELGYELAFWRAVENAAHKNLRRVNGKIKHNDNVRASQERKAQSEEVEILDENTVLYKGQEWSGVTFDFDGESGGFKFGDIVQYTTGMPSAFHDVYGMVLGTNNHYGSGSLAVFHPDLYWCDTNYITYVAPKYLTKVESV